MRSNKLCYDCQLSYGYHNNSGRCCCLVWKFLLYAGSRYLLVLFHAAANHFGCGSVTQTSDANQVLQALSEGHPVISSQRAGLFTSGGHFIVLRGVTADSKVLVNDPNDNSSKNYINREFDMMSEVHATSNAYWIFDKK